MAWLKVDQTLLRHEKTFIFAEKLDMEEVHVIGYLIALWHWALDYYPDGKLPDSDRLIARACQWDGPAEPFVDALIIAGFVDDDFAGNRTIHNWEAIRPYPEHYSLRQVWNKLRDTVAPTVFHRQGQFCAYCKATKDLTIDHIKPISKGGSNELTNLQVLCRSCNSSKKDKYDGMD